MTPQDRQRIQDFEEYRMFCQMRETQALSTPTPFSQAISMSGSPPGGPPNTPSTRVGPVPRAFVKPRVGGLDKAGPWTGHGKGLMTCSPRTENCRRGFYGDQLKAMHQQTKIDTVCQKGLAEDKILYSLRHETGAAKTSTISRKLREHLVECSLEAVFE